MRRKPPNRNAKLVKARSRARAAARAGRACATCGRRIKAKRASKRYCSTRCRVASHRQERIAEAMRADGEAAVAADRAAWLRDHAGQTAADYDRARSCAATDAEYEAMTKLARAMNLNPQ